MAYTYEDFENARGASPVGGQFSQYDIDLAKRHPEAGMSLLSLKQDYAKATTDEQKLLINEAANQIRNSFGSYTGGSDGSKYLYNGTKTDSLLDKVTGYSPYSSRNEGAMQGTLDKIGSFGSFSYDKDAPIYQNAYAQQQQAMLDSIINRPDFSWSKEEDPQWASYKKSYLREGERATADTLGQLSAASGGRPSSYAATAAAQAGDYYAAKLNDVIPTLYQQAYDRYLQEFQMKQQALNAVNQQEQLDYNRYLTDLGQFNTDRNFDYQAYLDDFIRLQNQLGAYQSAEQLDRNLYQQTLDNLISQYGAAADREDTLYGRTWQEQALAQEQAEQQKSFYQQQLDAMLAAGASPSAEMIAGSGYANEYVQAMENYYKQQAMAGLSSGGSYSPKSSSGGSVSMDYESLFKAAMESGNPQSFIENSYKNYGFTSRNGLWNDYKNWADGQTAQIDRLQRQEADDWMKDWILEDTKRRAASKTGTSKDYASLDYRPDEGVFTWAGKDYANMEKLEAAMGRATLTGAQKSALERKFSMFGFDVDFDWGD